MQDGIISGNGNSRYLKTVSAALGLYPTYEDFMAALIAGTFPIDLNGINTAGWTQQGTPLNKANLLADETATSLGIGTNATPDMAFNKLLSLIADKPDIVFGTYTGDGAAERTISLGFTPKAVLLFELSGQTVRGDWHYGGLALQNFPCLMVNGSPSLEVVTNGFKIFESSSGAGSSSTNSISSSFNPYRYAAFK